MMSNHAMINNPWQQWPQFPKIILCQADQVAECVAPEVARYIVQLHNSFIEARRNNEGKTR